MSQPSSPYPPPPLLSNSLSLFPLTSFSLCLFFENEVVCPITILPSPTQPEFYEVCHTKKDYDEHGPSICRHNPVFGTMS